MMDDLRIIEDFSIEELTDELQSRMNGFCKIDTDDLIDELKTRSGVDYTEQDGKYKDWVVAIQDGEIKAGNGRAVILIVEG